MGLPSALSRTVPSSPRERPGHRTSMPVWTTGTMLVPAALCWLIGMPHASAIILAAAVRRGPLRFLLSLLPEIRDPADFEDRRYRVRQSVCLVSVCCAIYALIPDDARQQQGWKQNLVTMETSMASGIAATYGYSVAGGVPGGLLAEYVVSCESTRSSHPRTLICRAPDSSYPFRCECLRHGQEDGGRAFTAHWREAGKGEREPLPLRSHGHVHGVCIAGFEPAASKYTTNRAFELHRVQVARDLRVRLRSSEGADAHGWTVRRSGACSQGLAHGSHGSLTRISAWFDIVLP